MNAQELIARNLLVKMRAGSQAYGTALPTSDEDFRGIFCADPINIRTPFFVIEEAADTSEEDTKFYELRQFMKLCLDCNPNIIELLWTDDADIVFRTPAYDLIRAARGKLLSSKVAFTTSGYAISQLKRIKGHNKWINNPQPEAPPSPGDFVSLVQWFGAEKVMPRDFDLARLDRDHQLVPYGEELFGVYPAEGYTLLGPGGSLNKQFDGERETLPPPLALIRWNKEEYRVAKDRHQQFWTWKQNRNAVRNELEERHGYDTKHAMHLVRLLRMGLEALRDGVIHVKRPDAEELLAIRAGAWTYDQLVDYAERMDKEIREVWYLKTALPKKADREFAARLLMDAQDLVWGARG